MGLSCQRGGAGFGGPLWGAVEIWPPLWGDNGYNGGLLLRFRVLKRPQNAAVGELMRVALGLALALVCFRGLEAEAGIVEEHPEWFNFTEYPEGEWLGVSGAGSPGVGSRVLLRLMPSVTAYSRVLEQLRGEASLIVVVGGDTEVGSAEEYLAAEGWLDGEYEIWNAGGLNSHGVGDYGFVGLRSAEGKVAFTDGKFDAGKPLDDAMASKWVLEETGGCAYRVPLLFQRGLLESNGAGFCLLSSKISTMNPQLSEGQIVTMVKRYMGCHTVVLVQPLTGDPRGRIDTLFRFSSEVELLAGVYEAWQDAGNGVVIKKNLELIEKLLPEGMSVTTLPMPTPTGEAGEAGWPSYLSFIVTSKSVMVPVFPTEGSVKPAEESGLKAGALAELGKAFSGLEVVEIPSQTLLAVGLRLNGMLLWVPEGEIEPCANPEVICSGNVVESCSGCFDECPEKGSVCASETEVGACKEATEGCLAIERTPCPGDWICVDGGCEAPPSPCDDMPVDGRCEGDSLLKCVGSTLIKVECHLQGLICAANSDGKPACVPFCVDGCDVEGERRCEESGVGLEVCGVLGSGCLGWISEGCESGACVEGECVPVVSDVVEEPSGDMVQEVGEQDAKGFSGGYGAKESCSVAAGVGGRGGLLALALLLMLAFFGLGRVRTKQ